MRMGRVLGNLTETALHLVLQLGHTHARLHMQTRKGSWQFDGLGFPKNKYVIQGGNTYPNHQSLALWNTS